MEKVKRILAWIGVLVLVGLYLTTFIASIFQSEFSSNLFIASLYCTVIVPIMLYVYMLVYKVLKKKNSEDSDKTK